MICWHCSKCFYAFNPSLDECPYCGSKEFDMILELNKEKNELLYSILSQALDEERGNEEVDEKRCGLIAEIMEGLK